MIIKIKNSENYSKKTRKSKDIKLIVIHYTGMQSKIESIKRLLNPKHKVSCHYLIDRNGKVTKMVDENKVAWHAGKSKWKNFKNLNDNSIGIELVNKGHEFGYEKFTNSIPIEFLLRSVNFFHLDFPACHAILLSSTIFVTFPFLSIK